MKLCRDCQHCNKKNGNNYVSWECRAPENQGNIDLVSGEIALKFRFCHTQRGSLEGCSEEGTWFKKLGHLE